MDLEREKLVGIYRKQNFPSHFLVMCLDAAQPMNKAQNYKSVYWSGDWNLLVQCWAAWNNSAIPAVPVTIQCLEGTEVPLYGEGHSSTELWEGNKAYSVDACMLTLAGGI